MPTENLQVYNVAEDSDGSGELSVDEEVVEMVSSLYFEQQEKGPVNQSIQSSEKTKEKANEPFFLVEDVPKAPHQSMSVSKTEKIEDGSEVNYVVEDIPIVPLTELQRGSGRMRPNPGAQIVSNPHYQGDTSSTQDLDDSAAAEEVSAVVAEEVDEEAQAKIAQKKARESILKEMVHGEVVTGGGGSSNKRGYFAIAVAIFVVGIIAIVLGLVLSRDDSSGIEDVLSDYDYLFEILSPISGEDILMNETSNQFKAFTWILEQDDFLQQGGNNTLRNFDESKLVERYSLALLYYATQGDQWTQNFGFLSNVSVCEWLNLNENGVYTDGILCNDDGRITDITLVATNLNGTVPAELGSLTMLRILKLDENALYGSIPEELGGLELLTRFTIEINSLTGTIPDSFSSLSNLQAVALSINSLSGSLPQGIFQIESLTSLSAEWNHLTGTIPEFIPRGNFESLWLGGNSLSGKIPGSLFSNVEMEDLSLYENQLTGTIPTKIGEMEKLFLAYVDGNKLNGTLPTELGNLRSMEFLWLGKNSIGGPIPSELGKLGKFNIMTELILEDTLLTGTVPSELGLLSVYTMGLFGTSLVGDLDPVFCEDESLAIPKLTADCGGAVPEVKCSCCTTCCEDANLTCTANVPLICSRVGDQVADPNQKFFDFVIIQDDVKPLQPNCTCTDIPASNNETSVAGLIPAVELSCNEGPKCAACTPDGSTCGQRVNYGIKWDDRGQMTHQYMGFQYTKGLDDLLLLEFDVSPGASPYPEAIYLNGERCNEIRSEAICADGKPAFEVDCSNLREGAIYTQCDGVVDDAGVLEYFTPNIYGVLATCQD